MIFRRNTILGGFYLSQLCVGVIGNSLLFMMYVYSFLIKSRFSRPIDPIFMHLMIVNVLTIIFAMISHIMSSFGVPRFLDDVGCKAVLYIFRVTRGLSICTTSILSTFQAITITPSNSKWAWLKPKLSTWTFRAFLLSWLINLFIYAHVIESVTVNINYTDLDYGYSHAYCKMRPPEYPNPGLFLSVIIIGDIVFLTLMMWTSFYMVTVLYRHRKRAQHLHSTSLSCQPSPERKATHSILLLVSFFVFVYLLHNFITLCGFYAQTKIPRLEVINVILTTCYPTISPFLLMKNNKLILQFTSLFSMVRMTCFQSALYG
ncbi:vomeronasal type-1 receptor 4-like [Peromyscus californicus insignis]|uniref:vomeronasal type-1 receptor 4-like n=1 Tax=Peromyscus californicus insignis TaxID=564181 RepID=UPI0022A6B069|nr:vomeronasal type-1 receptor 4-like [Peromyscus californicus insignis]